MLSAVGLSDIDCPLWAKYRCPSQHTSLIQEVATLWNDHQSTLVVIGIGLNVRVGSMLSKKSFGGNKRNFLKLLMRFVRSDVRDHIASQKNDHGPSYRH